MEGGPMSRARMGEIVATWLYALLAAAISGAAGAVGGALGGMAERPDVFNAADGLPAVIGLARTTAIVGAIIGLAGYLKQSPLPARTKKPAPD
jgi:hypothetical protein